MHFDISQQKNSWFTIVVDVAVIIVVVVVTQSAPFMASLLNDQLYYSVTGLDSEKGVYILAY